MSKTYEPTSTAHRESVASAHRELWRMGALYSEAWWIDYTDYLPVRVHPTIDQPSDAQYPDPPRFSCRNPGTAVNACQAIPWSACAPSGTVFFQPHSYSANNLASGYGDIGWFQYEAPGSESLTGMLIKLDAASYPLASYPRGFSLANCWSGLEADNGTSNPPGLFGQWSGFMFRPDNRVDAYGDTDWHNIAVWTQTLLCRRGRLRITQAKSGWLGSVEIYAATSAAGNPNGWDDYVHGLNAFRLGLGPVAYVRPYVCLPFGGAPFISTNVSEFGNEIPMPDLTPGDISSGWLGRVCFFVWGETPAAWSARTGLAVAGAP